MRLSRVTSTVILRGGVTQCSGIAQGSAEVHNGGDCGGAGEVVSIVGRVGGRDWRRRGGGYTWGH